MPASYIKGTKYKAKTQFIGVSRKAEPDYEIKFKLQEQMLTLCA